LESRAASAAVPPSRNSRLPGICSFSGRAYKTGPLNGREGNETATGQGRRMEPDAGRRPSCTFFVRRLTTSAYGSCGLSRPRPASVCSGSGLSFGYSKNLCRQCLRARTVPVFSPICGSQIIDIERFTALLRSDVLATLAACGLEVA
jgi:hypothetical protein